MRFSRLFSRQRPDAYELAARCAAADRLVAEHEQREAREALRRLRSSRRFAGSTDRTRADLP